MNTPDAHDPNARVSTGGGGYVSGDVHAGGDVHLGAKNIAGDEVYGDKIVHQYGDGSPLPPFTPTPPPPPDELPDPGPLPPGSRLAYSRNPLFTGREDDLLTLAAHLLPAGGRLETGDSRLEIGGSNDERPNLQSPISSLISSGIGGIGKTQLAVEFAHRYGRFFHGVHWISMADPAAVATEIALCGAEMRLRPDFDALPPAAQVRETLAAWAGPEARLLIFDNCELPALLAEWRPKSGGARVLATSRNTVWPVEYGAATLLVNPLSRGESLALLREYVPVGAGFKPAPTEGELAQLAAEVGDLPLALALAGHYLARYKRHNVETYLGELRSAAELVPIGVRAFSPTDHDLSVWRTFAVSFNKLEFDDEVDTAAVALLARAACFAPGEPLPEGLLLAAMAVDDGQGDDRRQTTDDGLLRLLELGLLERAGDDAYRLHRLIARFVGEEISRKDAENAAEEGLMLAARAVVEGAVIDLAYKQNTAGDPRALREWEIHLRHVTDATFDREDNTVAALCFHLGHYLWMSGDLAAARPYLERTLTFSERVLGPDDPATALNLNNMGELLRAMGDLAAARPYLERALAVHERVLGPDHPNTATSLNNMGFLLQAMGDLLAAWPYLERALDIRERVLGPDHPDTAQSLNNMGFLLQAMGDPSAARPYYERALAVRERVLGPDHPDTAQSLNNMGFLLRAVGDLTAARPYYERALAVKERVLGPDHPDTATSCNNLGILCYHEGNLPDAVAWMRRALAIREKALGPQHTLTRQTRNNLAAIEAAMRGS